jgi:putative ABC transport system permease protein
MRANMRGATAAPSRLRAVLVVTELALSLVLLVGSGLLAMSFVNVSRTPLGFETEHILTMRLSLPDGRYDEQRRAAFIERLLTQCRGVPGVAAAAVTSTLPLTGDAEGWGLAAEGNPRPDDYTMARVRAVTRGYFRTLGIRLLAGRDVDQHDRGTNPVAIVSQSLARSLWPGVTDPIGRRLAGSRPATIVGIVDDTRASGIDAEVRPYLYVPFGQFTPAEFALAVRSPADPTALVKTLKAQIWQLDQDQPVTHIASMEQIVSGAMAARRFPAVLMTLFAAFALLLTAIGVYGVLSYSVAQRTHEIGIRMALGASRGQVVAQIFKQACLMAGAGGGLGLVAAFRFTSLLQGLLYGVATGETPVFAASAGLLVAVALAASMVPAWRAAALDPLKCLRYE